jgi:hypothetical protein
VVGDLDVLRLVGRFVAVLPRAWVLVLDHLGGWFVGLRGAGQGAEEDADTGEEEQQSEPAAEGATAEGSESGTGHGQHDGAEHSPAVPVDQHAAPPRDHGARLALRRVLARNSSARLERTLPRTLGKLNRRRMPSAADRALSDAQ